MKFFFHRRKKDKVKFQPSYMYNDCFCGETPRNFAENFLFFFSLFHGEIDNKPFAVFSQKRQRTTCIEQGFWPPLKQTNCIASLVQNDIILFWPILTAIFCNHSNRKCQINMLIRRFSLILLELSCLVCLVL